MRASDMSQSILRSFVFTSILVFSFGLAAQSPDVLHWVGRVLDTDGQPLSGALVALVPRVASEDLKEIPTTRTNDEGGFEITAPSELTDISIAASAHIPLVRSLRLRAAKFGANQSPLEFKLEKGGCRVRGTLKAATGFGLEDGLLAFYNNHSGEMGPFFAPLDPEGRFEITLAASYYDIQAQALGQARIWQQCEITGERSDVKLELQPLPTPAPPEVSTWIQSHAIPLKTFHAGQGFDDMQPLKDLVGSARIVALGEATHGTSEFFRLKHRMLEFLVEEMGFRDFAIEANLPEAFAIDDYLQSGQGDPAKALAGLHFWPWNTEEFLDMLRWMRSYNAKPIHKQQGRPGGGFQAGGSSGPYGCLETDVLVRGQETPVERLQHGVACAHGPHGCPQGTTDSPPGREDLQTPTSVLTGCRPVRCQTSGRNGRPRLVHGRQCA